MASGAFPVSLTPYSVQTDEETGTVGIRSLLRAWAVADIFAGKRGEPFSALPADRMRNSVCVSAIQRVEEKRENTDVPPGKPGGFQQVTGTARFVWERAH